MTNQAFQPVLLESLARKGLLISMKPACGTTEANS
jgi:hypothetical protein